MVDEGCDEENSQSVPLASSCETCVPLDELVVEQGIIVDGDQNVCENDDVIFTMDKAPEIAPNQVIVYTVQRVPTQFYDENEVIIDSIPSDPTNFTFNINSSSVFVVGEDYYISAFVFSEVQTGFKPDENCKGILARTLTFYETPEAEITNLEDDTNICINEFDYQIGLSNTVTSSAFSSSDPEVSIFYIEGDTRALINAGAVTSDELVITLTQTINHTTTDGVLECSDMTDLTLNVLDKVSPSKDTIISFPGNMYTFVSDGFCYQWGLNDDLLTGETDRFYIADGALSEGDVLWINVWDCADDALECVSTIYYNVLEPPKTEINPEKELVYNLYPNPNEGIFNLELDGPQGGQFNAYLYDATGKLVQSISFIKDEIIHNQVIGFQDSSPGLYLLQVLGENGEKQLIKIIKH